MTVAANNRPLTENPHCVLTPRQAQVVLLAAEGLTAKETARRLGISKNTVDEYIREAKHRVKASTKAELTAWAMMANVAASPMRNGPGITPGP